MAVLEYDGTDFYGWQIQKDRRTVQGVLEGVLSQRLNEHVSVVGAGRTDKGVHAVGQVMHFDYTCSEPVETLFQSLNAMMPQDISLVRLEKVSGDFHARFSAVRRSYRYEMCLEPSALVRRYCWEVPPELNTARIRKAIVHLRGAHNFKPLSKQNPAEKHYRCTVNDVSLKRHGNHLTFRITADRFLRGMVRAIMGILVDVGRGAKEPDVFKHMLAYSDRTLLSNLAPARGLFLEKVEY